LKRWRKWLALSKSHSINFSTMAKSRPNYRIFSRGSRLTKTFGEFGQGCGVFEQTPQTFGQGCREWPQARDALGPENGWSLESLLAPQIPEEFDRGGAMPGNGSVYKASGPFSWCETPLPTVNCDRSFAMTAVRGVQKWTVLGRVLR